ncbi:hypothetical protein RclHR1_17460008 [Rhizophagus clarus]|uniref:Uncharacterized protein n=1 Tax=Rhizophagus clarus TaxID=94130 RepID=A0A2Z6QJQ4_9GLOM|nr:hypothetical protein RclHR1_16760001 [Rhizophagus clarus]GBB90481.1 hypothetical protein RclHR1_17460008 [Rhizophagus clarus]GES75516.1 hypothetical protein RCL_jg9048.t1 [Rhizophagus clarus]
MSTSLLEEFNTIFTNINSNNNIISRPPSVLYRYHKTPIQVSSNIESAYDFPLGIYNPTNPTAIQQIDIDNYYYFEDIRKDNKQSKGGLFGTLRRKKRNNRKNISVGTSNRNSAVYDYEDETIRRYSV